MKHKQTSDPYQSYISARDYYTTLHKKLSKTEAGLSNLRIFVFVVGIASTILLFYLESYRASSMLFSLTLVSFIYLIVQHEKVKEQRIRVAILVEINQASLDRLEGKWTNFQSTGEEYKSSDHPYSSDLDIFGDASLFQMINVTTTHFGKLFLKERLTNPKKDIEQIKQIQQAVAELAEELEWRQEFQTEGLYAFKKSHDPKILLKWAESDETAIKIRIPRVLLVTLSVITLSAIIGALTSPVIPISLPLLLIVLHVFIVTKGYKQRVFEATGRYKDSIFGYSGLVKMIEETPFSAPYLTELKLNLINDKGRMASKQMKGLARIVELMDLRYNALYHFLINNLFFWDYHCILALEKWKKESGKNLPLWLETIGEYEFLCSLAIIRYDNPNWAFPELSEKPYTFLSDEMGHPLLPQKSRICNDLSMQGAGNILIITGSNMSGKSTLLRTVGINLVLAYLGAPVCAKELKCSMMNLYSSMRVNDNLEKSISSFYAELLRIKMIVQASRKKEPLLFLLDEIFRGTNTHDRHIGAKNVLKNLSKEGAMGLVSTHDLELGELEKEKNLKIKNYHFAESYVDNQICFDYKLRSGLSTTSNAIYLMKMVGIDIT